MNWKTGRKPFEDYRSSDKLKGKVALVTGGDSGIGKSAAVHFAREGADVAIVYLEENRDAKDTQRAIEKEGHECLLIKGDVRDENFCKDAVQRTVDRFGKLNVVVNNAAVQFPEENFVDIDTENLHRTFETNIYAYFYILQAAMKYLGKGDTIINTTSVTAYRGSPAPYRLREYKRSHRRLHQKPLGKVGRERDTRQRGRARSDLDTPYPGHFR